MLTSYKWPVTAASAQFAETAHLPVTNDLDPVLRRLQEVLKSDNIIAVDAAADTHANIVASLGDGAQADASRYLARLLAPRYPCPIGERRALPQYGQQPQRLLPQTMLAREAVDDSSVLLLRVPAGPHGSVAIIAVRRTLRTPFTTNDERTLQRYADWVADYVTMWWRLLEGEKRRIGLQGALDQVGLAMIMLDRDAHIVGTNRAARALLAAGDGLVAVGDILSTAVLEDAVRLHSAIGHALVGAVRGARSPVLTIRRKHRRPLVVAVLRVAVNPRSGETAVVLQAIDPDLNHNSAIDAACAIFGLTGAETRLVKSLVGGASLAEAAAALRIQMPTARTYLKQAFAKSGTNRQAALVQLLLSSLVRAGADTELAAVLSV